MIAVVPPWNFPYAIPAGGVFAALAAGSAVILKPPPQTPATASLLARLVAEAGSPTDLVQYLRCPDDEVGRHFVTHPSVGAVVLTGSIDTAALFRDWHPRMRLHAETSGKNAIVVTATADVDQAVRDIVRSAFGHAGRSARRRASRSSRLRCTTTRASASSSATPWRACPSGIRRISTSWCRR